MSAEDFFSGRKVLLIGIETVGQICAVANMLENWRETKASKLLDSDGNTAASCFEFETPDRPGHMHAIFIYETKDQIHVELKS